MSKLLLHPLTRLSLDNIVKNPVHGIGIEGLSGSGKKTVSKYIAAQLLKTENVDNQPYVRTVDCSGDVGIEEVRDCIKFLALKIPGSSLYRRCLIFWSLENLSTEAQNALLKSLEEPPADTLIIITSESKDKLLPTTVSRLSWISVLPITLEAAREYLDNKIQKGQLETAYALSGGKTGMLFRLLEDYDNNPFVKYINLAKQSLVRDKFEQMAQVDELSKDKDLDIKLYLDALAKIFETALSRQIHRTGVVNQKVLRAMERVVQAQEAAQRGANKKLILSGIFYNL